MQTRKKSVTVKSGYRLKVKERLRESEINFVFCEWVLYVGTAPEQKTESAKNGKDSMSLPFFQPLRVQQVAPTSLCKGGKEVYLFGVPEKRKLFGDRRKEWSVYYKFFKNLFEHGISFDVARFCRFIEVVILNQAILLF